MTKGPKPQPPEERFWSKVLKTDGCWLWSGAKKKDGYGRITFPRGEVSTHRLSWEMHFGPIPEGKHVLHRCDNPPCVRPDHLFLGDQAANNQDKTNKGRNVAYKGERHGRAKLTEDDVRKIRSLSSSMNNEEIASCFNVSSAAVHQILVGRNWKHVQ